MVSEIWEIIIFGPLCFYVVDIIGRLCYTSHINLVMLLGYVEISVKLMMWHVYGAHMSNNNMLSGFE